MYTPLEYMEQIENMVAVQGPKHLTGALNKKNTEWFTKLIERDHGRCVRMGLWGWNHCLTNKPLTPELVAECNSTLFKYTVEVGLVASDKQDFWLLMIVYCIYTDWHRNKRVYKIEKNMLHDLSTMAISNNLPSSVVTKLPAKCFYIDWEGEAEYCPDASGMFVLYDVVDGVGYYSLLTIIRRERLIPILTVLKLEDAEGAEVRYDSYAYRSERIITLEDNSTCVYNEAMAVKMFYNFCAYLSAINSDVEYTERTRNVYRPVPKDATPKNKIREIEEFGVGFSYTTVRKKKVVRYTDKQSVKPSQKRAYSSCYRAAHWQHYWINDPDVEGNKKCVLKWIEGTYVRGNRTTDKVNVHVIK